MSSKVFRVTIGNVPHLINMNRVSKVALIDNSIKLYLDANQGLFGLMAGGFGWVSGNDLKSIKLNYESNEEAKKAFDKIAELM
jgi:hypothetical protein